MTPRVHAEWGHRVAAEYRSASIAAQTLHRAIQCGLPDALLRMGQRIVDPERDGPLAGLVDSVGRNFCLGETFAVPLFAAMRERTTHPAARPVLDRVLRDEAVHRAFGWDALDALLERAPDDVRARLAAQWHPWLAGFRRSYGTLHPEQSLTDDEIGCGLVPIAVYVEVHDRCVAEDIGPRLAKRGMAL